MKSTSTKVYRLTAILDQRTKSRDLLWFLPFRHTSENTRRQGDKEIKLECESTKAEDYLYQIHFVSAK